MRLIVNRVELIEQFEFDIENNAQDLLEWN